MTSDRLSRRAGNVSTPGGDTAHDVVNHPPLIVTKDEYTSWMNSVKRIHENEAREEHERGLLSEEQTAQRKWEEIRQFATSMEKTPVEWPGRNINLFIVLVSRTCIFLLKFRKINSIRGPIINL